MERRIEANFAPPSNFGYDGKIPISKPKDKRFLTSAGTDRFLFVRINQFLAQPKPAAKLRRGPISWARPTQMGEGASHVREIRVLLDCK
jgi:hypothetical protein